MGGEGRGGERRGEGRGERGEWREREEGGRGSIVKLHALWLGGERRGGERRGGEGRKRM